MPAAVENSYVSAKLDELEPAPRLSPGAPDDGRQRFDVRRRLGITEWTNELTATFLYATPGAEGLRQFLPIHDSC